MSQENPFHLSDESRTSSPAPNQSTFQAAVASAREEGLKLTRALLDAWSKQTILGKLVLIIIGILFACLCGVMVVFHEPLLDMIVDYSDKWSHIPWMPFALGSALFVISFPPIIGFSFVNTVIGVLYGISFKGWLTIAIGSISGSVASFLVFRYYLHTRAQALISSNKKLYAFSSVLRDNNSFWILALIRVCPFPYSLTNGALAAVPGITITNFALGSIISSPKLVMYLFIGTKIKDIGQTRDPMSRFVDIASIVLTMVALTLTGWLLFTRTTKRLQELEREGALPASAAVDDHFERHFEDDEDQYNDTLSLHTQDDRRQGY